MLQYDSNTAYNPTPDKSSLPPSKFIYEKSASKASGRWTKEEHQKFIEGLKLFGKNWKQVEEHIGTRNGAQIRSHAQKFFNRLEREFNLKIEDLNLQSDRKKLEETLKKLSESPEGNFCSFKEDEIKDMKIVSKLPKELSMIPENASHKLEALSQATFHQNALSQCNSPKIDHFECPGFNRRAARKMSEDILHMPRTNNSVFDVILSKIRTANNRVTSPRLSDIVDISTSSRSSFDAGSLKGDFGKPQIFAGHFTANSSFRPNPRKMSEDNVLINLNQLRRPEDSNRFSGIELLTKKFKVN